VYRLSHKGGGWVFAPLYSFGAGNDGAGPISGVTIGLNGSLYGTTAGGGAAGHGTVYNVKPALHASANILTSWSESVLYSFAGIPDGDTPYGDLIFDQAGNIFGTTNHGGLFGVGAIYEMVPTTDGWTEHIVYSFTGGSDGGYPNGGLVLDTSGSFYGTTYAEGTYGCGTVFELTPSGSEWIETTLYEFNPSIGDGCGSEGSLVFDKVGNLFGTTVFGGLHGGGTVFKLSPQYDGTWAETVLYAFTGSQGPSAAVTMDGFGNLYGTAYQDGFFGYGSVFKLIAVDGGYLYVDLYDFTGGSDGSTPIGHVVMDINSNLYGTAFYGGEYGNGVVWEITP
jgi:uncharacterized repeat protein (TIGR03803 family)